MLLYWAVNHPADAKLDPQMFNIMIWGMDANAKVTRLREAMRARNARLAPELKARLSHFQSGIVDLRNKLVHTWPMWLSGSDRLATLQAMDFVRRVDLSEYETEKYTKAIAQYTIDGDELFEHTAWLNWFALDLLQIVEAVSQQGPPPKRLGIETYRSGEPMGFPIGSSLSDDPAKLHMLARKQAEAEAARLRKMIAQSQRKPSAKQRRVAAIGKAKKAKKT